MEKFRKSRSALVATAVFACSSGEDPAAGVRPPDAPTAVAIALESGAVVMTWTDESDDEDEFVIGRVSFDMADQPIDANALEIIGSVAADETRFVDDSVASGLHYGYGVAARKNAAGRSEIVVQSGAALLVPLPVEPGACGGAPAPDDADGDGLTDEQERDGWTIRVDENGQGATLSRRGFSDPMLGDTDGDGLCDREESTLRTDPRRADTDSDGLTDKEEVERWGSSPTNVDGDGDAEGNSLFFDGAEVLTYGTSPTLADTDGDGRSDFQEINQDGTNALVADLPVPSLELVGEIDLGVNIRLENGTTETNAESHSFGTATSRSSERTSGSATQASIETSVTVGTQAEVSYPWSGGGSVSAGVSQTAGYMQTTSTDVTASSAQEATAAYERTSSRVVSSGEEIVDGTIAVNLEIANRGTRTFELGSLVLTALRRNRANPSDFTSVATLELPMEARDIVLGEGDVRGPFRVEADLAANTTLDLLANPTGLVFATSSFALTDRTGENFEFQIGEETNNRTAAITIDFGGLRPVERYRVATNVERTPDGQPAGVLLGDVLGRVLGLTEGVGYETATSSAGVEVPVRFRDVAAVPNASGGSERFWLFFAADNDDSTARLLDPSIDFGAKRLMPRDAIFLAYVADRDGDRLIAREERLYGASDDNPDSDGDGLTDYEEAREGWEVDADLAIYRTDRRVYSNPTLVDADRDGLDDPTERTLGTDPNRRDTDGDGLLDDEDPEPLRGPTGSWIVSAGTSDTEQVFHAEATNDRVVVLGHSDGDIDGDGADGGPFLLGFDAEDGTQLWAKQLEGVTDYTKTFAITADGNVMLFAELTANVLAGGNPATTHTIVWDADGNLVQANNLVATPYNGAFDFGRITAHHIVPSPGGATAYFGELQLSGNGAVRSTLFDANGAYASQTAFGIPGSTVVPNILAVGAAGRLVAVSTQRAASCRIELFRNTGGYAGAFLNFCEGAGTPVQVGVDRENGLHVALRQGGTDTVARYGLGGRQLETRGFPGFVTPRVTSLIVDDANQIITAVGDAGSPRPVQLEARGLTGDLLWRAELGDSSTSIARNARDRVGNLYSAGTTIGGFAGEITGAGGPDVVLIRNAQIRYEVP